MFQTKSGPDRPTLSGCTFSFPKTEFDGFISSPWQFVSWPHCDPSSRAGLTQLPSPMATSRRWNLLTLCREPRVGKTLHRLLPRRGASSPLLTWTAVTPSVTLQLMSRRTEPIFNRGRTFLHSQAEPASNFTAQGPGGVELALLLVKPANPYTCFPESCSDQGSEI